MAAGKTHQLLDALDLIYSPAGEIVGVLDDDGGRARLVGNVVDDRGFDHLGYQQTVVTG